MAWHYLETNQYGSQTGWGTDDVDSYIITQNQIDNASEMWNYFRYRGYSEQATAAIIGNAMHESLLNPAQYEYYTSMTDFSVYGLGLLMWTPKSKIRNYANSVGGNMYDGNLQCNFYIQNESEGWDMYRGLTQYPRYPYIVTPAEFKVSTADVTYLAEVFGCNYEGGNYDTKRGRNSVYWYEYFTGTPPQPPEPPVSGGGAWFGVFHVVNKRNRHNPLVYRRKRGDFK